MDDLEKLKIGVVAGGISSEREISLKSYKTQKEIPVCVKKTSYRVQFFMLELNK